jgi:hypothetical protein
MTDQNDVKQLLLEIKSSNQNDKKWMLQEFKDLRVDFKSLVKSVDERLDRVKDSSKIPAGFWIQIMSLLVVLVGGGAAVAIFAIQSAVLPVQITTTYNAQAIDKLDTVLQREMRLLDATTSETIKLNNEAQDVLIDQLTLRLQAIIQWQESHDQRVVGLNSRQSESIRNLERKVFPLLEKDK